MDLEDILEMLFALADEEEEITIEDYDDFFMIEVH